MYDEKHLYPTYIFLENSFNSVLIVSKQCDKSNRNIEILTTEYFSLRSWKMKNRSCLEVTERKDSLRVHQIISRKSKDYIIIIPLQSFCSVVQFSCLSRLWKIKTTFLCMDFRIVLTFNRWWQNSEYSVHFEFATLFSPSVA